MIRRITALSMALAAAVLASAAMAQTPPPTAPGGGMKGSHHDGTLHGIDALCAECHTPHQAFATSLLWNHTLTTSTFTWDDTYTTAGTKYPTFKGDTYKGGTAKCLSCHDGTLTTKSGMWYNDAVQPDGTYHCGDFGRTQNCLQGLRGGTHGGGTLSGAHPVAMPYPFGQAVSTYNGTATGTGAVLGEWVSDPTAVGIRLYTDTGSGITAGATSGKTGMECGSCHDVHNGAQTQDDYLLRGMKSGSTGGANGYICLKCHNK